MTVQTYRKRPVEVAAMQLTDTTFRAVVDWAEPFVGAGEDEQGMFVVIRTLEGDVRAREGDWVIRGVAGEFYPCRADIFDATYESAAPLPVADGRCGHPACDGKDAYRMAGSCSNCMAGPFELLFTAGHPGRALDCPVCGVDRLQPSRAASGEAVAS